MHRLEERYFRYGQVGSASLVSIAHGTNDAQKTMGVMTLALIASGHWTSTTAIPVWVKFSAAGAIAARHLPRRLADHPHPGQGAGRHHPPPGHVERRQRPRPCCSRRATSGFALSTTHVATGSVLGGGLGRGTPVRWSTAGRMVTAWATTFPIAGPGGRAACGGSATASAGRSARSSSSRSSRRSRRGSSALAPRARRRAQRQRRLGPHRGVTSPAYEHAPVTHAQNGFDPTQNGSGPRSTGPVPPGPRTPTSPTVTRSSPPRPRPTEDGCHEHSRARSSRAPARSSFAGLVFGAGLPFVYALALRVLTIGSTAYADASGEIHSTPTVVGSRLFAGLLIAVVVAGVVARADDHRGDRPRQGSRASTPSTPRSSTRG